MLNIQLTCIVFCYSSFLLTFYGSYASSVPVFILDTSKSVGILPALSSVEQEVFSKILLDRVSSNIPVLLFAEETLSPEDFALRDVDEELAFSSIFSQKSSAHITYWPSVKSPIVAMTLLSDRNIVKTSIKALLDDPAFIVHDNDIVIIELNDAVDGESRLDMLQRHDKYITDAFRRYAKSNNELLAMLTSYHSSWVLTDELRSVRRVRQTNDSTIPKADVDPSNKTGIIYSNKELLIYVNNSASLNYIGSSISLNDFQLVAENKKNATHLNATLESRTNPVSIQLSFEFSDDYWFLTNISITNTTGTPYYLWIRDVYAPVGFSYHCHGQTFFNMSNSNVNLSLPLLQMQVYFNNTGNASLKFGDAYDCVGFTSAPIWSGLFVTFIMAIILSIGLSMMMNIKTMDRFDDPKGKSITINASE